VVRLASADHVHERFEHEVIFYSGAGEHARALLPFIREGVSREEPTLVALLPEAIVEVEEALGPDAARVDFVDMGALGANPARIIPAWRSFLDQHGDEGPVRGVGEPIWAGRRDAELAEAELHESLLNVAFDDGPGWRLLCPYDVTTLPSAVLDEARRNHPVVHDAAAATVGYGGHEHARRTFTTWLPPAPDDAVRIDFGGDDLAVLRDVVRREGEVARLQPAAAEDLVLAAHELASNSVRHAGGRGTLRSWHEPDSVTVEVCDAGHIDDPLVGRDVPDLGSETGRGLWMANQLCDLVQVRSCDEGTQVRLYAWL